MDMLLAPIEKKVMTAPDRAREIVIADESTYQKAGEFLVDIKTMRKEVDAAFDPIITKAHQAHKEAVSQKKRIEAPLAEAESIVKPKMAAYHEEQERVRSEEQARLDAEARRQAEEARLAEAVELEVSGKVEEAEAVLSEPVIVAPVVSTRIAPKAEGVSMRKKWAYKITNARLIHPDYLIPDETKIRKIVEAMGTQAVHAVGGIEVFQETIVSAGRR